MPTKEQHLEKARQSETVAAKFDLSVKAEVEWALIVYAYSALHYVEAYFATINKHWYRHGHRETAIKRDVKIRDIYHDYEQLYKFGYDSRYDPTAFTRDDVARALPYFTRVKTFLSRFV